MTKDELNWILKLPIALRVSLVKKIWCIKEAAIKAFSTGDMMAYSICASTEKNATQFNLLSKHNKNINIEAKAIETNGIALALVNA